MWKLFLRRWPLSRFLVKTLRVNIHAWIKEIKFCNWSQLKNQSLISRVVLVKTRVRRYYLNEKSNQKNMLSNLPTYILQYWPQPYLWQQVQSLCIARRYCINWKCNQKKVISTLQIHIVQCHTCDNRYNSCGSACDRADKDHRSHHRSLQRKHHYKMTMIMERWRQRNLDGKIYPGHKAMDWSENWETWIITLHRCFMILRISAQNKQTGLSLLSLLRRESSWWCKTHCFRMWPLTEL